MTDPWVWLAAAYFAGVVARLFKVRADLHGASDFTLEQAEEIHGVYVGETTLPLALRIAVGVVVGLDVALWPLWVWHGAPILTWCVKRVPWWPENTDDVMRNRKFVAYPSGEVEELTPLDERYDRLHWHRMAARITAMKRSDGRALAIIIIPTERDVFSAMGLESLAGEGGDTRAVLDAHSHSLIIEDGSHGETHAACAKFANEWRAGRQLEECGCVEIELEPDSSRPAQPFGEKVH